jgi:hypothetical protein
MLDRDNCAVLLCHSGGDKDTIMGSSQLLLATVRVRPVQVCGLQIQMMIAFARSHAADCSELHFAASLPRTATRMLSIAL